MASRSCWSRFPPITLSAVTRDRRHRQDDELYVADPDVHWGQRSRINIQIRRTVRDGRTLIIGCAADRGYARGAAVMGDQLAHDGVASESSDLRVLGGR